MGRRADVLTESLVCLRLADLAYVHHRGQHRVLSRLRGLPVAKRAVQRRPAHDPGEHRGLREIEVTGVLVEVDLRRGRRADGAVSEGHAVEVHLQDLRLREAPFHGERQQRLGHLSLDGRGTVEQPHLHQLLGDRGGALDRVVSLDIHHRRPRDSRRIDAGLGVEVAIFDHHDRVGKRGTHRAQRFVVVLISRGVQVCEHGRPVSRVDNRVPGHVVREL